MKCAEVIKTWVNAGGHAEKTGITGEVFGTIVGLTVIISEVTANPTSKITFRDADGAIIIPDSAFAALADGSAHLFWFLSEQATLNATENPVAVFGRLTVTIDPSAAVAVEGEVLTVKVRIFVRED